MISSSNHSPIQPLAKYLDQIFRFLLKGFAPSITLMSGADFIKKLNYYVREADALLPKTHFGPFKISNLYTMASHDRMLVALGEFLRKVLPSGRHLNLSIDTIMQLTELVLHKNVFTYNGHIYRHVKGSPLSLSLTRTLCNIYLYDWQQPFLDRLGENSEFYGRFHDTALLTWDGPIDKLDALFTELDQQHPDIHIATAIGYNVYFLNTLIKNEKGQLVTRVYHDSKMQRHVLPYVVGHPRLMYR